MPTRRYTPSLPGPKGAVPLPRTPGNARLAQDNELADFLSRVHEEVVKEAKRLLAQRVAE
jgi:hypothetical protein